MSDTTTTTPTLSKITHHQGVGEYHSYSVHVAYHDEPANRIEFVGPHHGTGPVIMVMGDSQTFVTDPHRFGEFGPEWVRRFFA